MDLKFIDKVLAKLEQDQPNLNPEIKKTLVESISTTVDNLKRQAGKDSTTVILKLLGFDNRWGKWELDHCNGRGGNSPIGLELKPILQAEAVSMVQELTKQFDFTDINKTTLVKLVKTTKTAYQDAFNGAIRDQIEDIEKQAREDAAEVFPHVVQQLFGKTVEELRVDIITKVINGEEMSVDEVITTLSKDTAVRESIADIAKRI